MFALLFAAIPAGAVIGGVFSGWVSRVEHQGLAVIVCITVWGLAMAGFGFAVALADQWRTPMLVVALVMLVVGGAADMASAAFRMSMLQSAADDALRGRLQGVFIVVVAGGPRIADTLHGVSAAAVGTAAAAAGGGVLVVIGVVVASLAVPSFVRYRRRSCRLPTRRAPTRRRRAHTERMARTRVRRELTTEQVQRWVASLLILAVSAFPLGALVAVIRSIVDDGRHSDGVILLLVMAVIGVVALGAIRLVHRKPAFAPWILLSHPAGRTSVLAHVADQRREGRPVRACPASSRDATSGAAATGRTPTTARMISTGTTASARSTSNNQEARPNVSVVTEVTMATIEPPPT